MGISDISPSRNRLIWRSFLQNNEGANKNYVLELDKWNEKLNSLEIFVTFFPSISNNDISSSEDCALELMWNF